MPFFLRVSRSAWPLSSAGFFQTNRVVIYVGIACVGRYTKRSAAIFHVRKATFLSRELHSLIIRTRKCSLIIVNGACFSRLNDASHSARRVHGCSRKRKALAAVTHCGNFAPDERVNCGVKGPRPAPADSQTFTQAKRVQRGERGPRPYSRSNNRRPNHSPEQIDQVEGEKLAVGAHRQSTIRPGRTRQTLGEKTSTVLKVK